MKGLLHNIMHNVYTYTLVSALTLITNLYAPDKAYVEDKEKKSSGETNANSIEMPARPLSEYLYTGPLAGYKVTDLTARYLNFEGIVPDSMKVDPEGVIDNMWSQKIIRSKKNAWVKKFYEERADKYDYYNTEKMILEDYLNNADIHIRDIKLNFDWDKYVNIKQADWKRISDKVNGKTPLANYYLDSVKVKYLSDISSSITARHVAATFLTELMPGYDGIKNYHVTNFITQAYGPEFLELAPPAMYDTCLSYGFSQFTSYACFDDGVERRQASLSNLALPEHLQIPHSVYGFRGFDHFKATYLRTIDNLADLLGSFNDTQMKKLSNHWDSENIIKFMILSHHAPSLAYKITTKWVDKNGKGNLENYLNNRRSQKKKKSYMLRGIANYEALLQKQKEHEAHNREMNNLKIDY